MSPETSTDAPTRAQGDREPFAEPVPLTRPPLLVAITLAAVLLSVGLYAVLAAKVTTQVTAEGVMLSGGYVLPVVAPSAGQVTSVTVGAGDQLTAGQSIGGLLAPGGVATPLVTPLTGQVVQTMVQVGEVVEPGTPLAYLVDPNQPLVVTTLVPAEQAAAVRTGQAVRVVPVNGTANSPAYVAATVAGVQKLPVAPGQVAATAAGAVGTDPTPTTTTAGSAREVTVTFPGNPTSTDQLTWEGTPPAVNPFSQGATVRVEIITGTTSVVSVLGRRT